MNTMPSFQFSEAVINTIPNIQFTLITASSIQADKLASAIEDKKRNALAEITTNREEIVRTIAEFETFFSSYGYSCPLPNQFRSIEKKGFPVISPFIDILLLCEMSTGFLMGVQDRDSLQGGIVYDLATDKDSFQGMRKIINCHEEEIILRDDQGIIASFFQGPDHRTSVNTDTTSIIFYIFSTPKITQTSIDKAIDKVINEIEPYANEVEFSRFTAVRGGKYHE